MFSYYTQWGGVPGTEAKAACFESRRLRIETRFDFQVSKKQNVSSPLNSKDVDPP